MDARSFEATTRYRGTGGSVVHKFPRLAAGSPDDCKARGTHGSGDIDVA